MSADDRIYDIMAALKGKSEADDFESLVGYMSTLEELLELMMQENNALKGVINIVAKDSVKESIDVLGKEQDKLLIKLRAKR